MDLCKEKGRGYLLALFLFRRFRLCEVVAAIGHKMRPVIGADHRPDSLAREYFEQQRIRNSTVNDVSGPDAILDGVERRTKFREHAAMDGAVRM
jgi:hypothetical protein